VTTILGVGPQYDQPDPRGWLVFHGLPDDLQRAEAARQAADVDLVNRDWKRGVTAPPPTPSARCSEIWATRCPRNC
jgi:hypothetical protein